MILNDFSDNIFHILFGLDVSITTPDNTSVKTSDAGSTSTSTQIFGSTISVSTTERDYSSTTPQRTTAVETTIVVTTEDTVKSSTEKVPAHFYPSLPEDQHEVDNINTKYHGKTTTKGTERINTETSDTVALIIGIIAGALIAVILIILVILKFKPRSDGAFKVDDSKGYQQGPNAALLGNTSSTNGQTQYQLNGALRNGDKSQMQKSKKRDSKDIKEWYV